MERISLRTGSGETIRKIPEKWGLLGFWKGEELLYLVKTSDMRRKLKRMLENDDTTSPLKDLIHEADSVSYEVHPDSLSTLVTEKVMLLSATPVYNHRLQQYRDYVYLALDPRRFPFIGIQDYTEDEWAYLGPFRSRFFLLDVIDVFSRMLRLPFCETGQYPCEKYDNKVCRGWCLNLEKGAVERTTSENTLEKLEQLIKETYLYPQDAILSPLRSERNRYFNNLDFEKSELLDIELGLLESYYDWLRFLHQARKMTYQTETIGVQDGKLVWAKKDGQTYYFVAPRDEYRPNEILALPKEAVDECRILYEYKLKIENKYKRGKTHA